MKPSLEPKEASMLITFLNRVDLKGSESEAHAYLKSKLKAIVEYKELANVADLNGEKGHGSTS